MDAKLEKLKAKVEQALQVVEKARDLNSLHENRYLVHYNRGQVDALQLALSMILEIGNGKDSQFFDIA